MRELPVLHEVVGPYEPRGVELVTIYSDAEPADARRVVRQKRLTAPVLQGDHELLRRWNIDAYPWTVFLDRTGKPRFAIKGEATRQAIEQAIENLL